MKKINMNDPSFLTLVDFLKWLEGQEDADYEEFGALGMMDLVSSDYTRTIEITKDYIKHKWKININGVI